MSDEMYRIANTHEPAPIPNERPALWELVVRDMIARDQMGRKKFGTPLQHFNGRNAAVDAYQEVLDQAVYMRQMVDEFSTMLDFIQAAAEYMDDFENHILNHGAYARMRALRKAMGK